MATPDQVKSPDQASLAGSKPRPERNEGVRLIVGVRVLQVLILLLLWFVTSYFGTSCLDPFGRDYSASGKRHSERTATRQPHRQHA
jgi:hypothetical protein